MPDLGNRRPLASRQTSWAAALTRRLAAAQVTPNQISIAGMVFALIAGLAFWASGTVPGRPLWLILGAAGVQLRLLCNLLDGMVAVEGGRGTPDGPFWNEFPDRVADMLILLGVGLGVGAPALAWAAISFAILTAYVRALGTTISLPADFSGPMAKPHRMALITGAAVVSLIEPLWDGHGGVLRLSLWVVAIGAALTALRRAFTLMAGLRRRG